MWSLKSVTARISTSSKPRLPAAVMGGSSAVIPRAKSAANIPTANRKNVIFLIVQNSLALPLPMQKYGRIVPRACSRPNNTACQVVDHQGGEHRKPRTFDR
jgi:hypothetical protein